MSRSRFSASACRHPCTPSIERGEKPLVRAMAARSWDRYSLVVDPHPTTSRLQFPPRPPAVPALAAPRARHGAGALSTSAQASPLTVVVIEDDRVLRDGMRALLHAQPGFTVAMASVACSAAFARISVMTPTFVLLGVALARDNSVEVCMTVRALSPGSRIVITGLAASHRDVAAFVRAGAAGFTMQHASVTEFVSALRLVAAGERALPRGLTHTLFTQLMHDDSVAHRLAMTSGTRFTLREHQVIGLLGEGLSNTDIAGRLGIAVHTVKSHVHHVLEKLSLHTRLEIATRARSGAPSRA